MAKTVTSKIHFLVEEISATYKKVDEKYFEYAEIIKYFEDINN
jgi:hypothetical protein